MKLFNIAFRRSKLLAVSYQLAACSLLRIAVISLLLVTSSLPLFSQNVSINANGAAPDSSAMLDVQSTTRGLLLPRMTLAQRSAISSPAQGLIIFQVDNAVGLWTYDTNAAGWIKLMSSDDSIYLSSVLAAGNDAGGDSILNLGVLQSDSANIGSLSINSAFTFPNADGSNGQVLTTNGSGAVSWASPSVGNDWSLTGNAGTTSANFIGTTDTVPLFLRVNNQRSGLVDYEFNPGNTGFGYEVLESLTSGQRNAAFGYQTLRANTTGNNNTGFGFAVLNNATSGYSNSGFGSQALVSNTTGYENVAIGASAMYNNTSGQQNTAVGNVALTGNTTGSFNTAVGLASQLSNTVGLYNTSIGSNSLRSNTTSGRNVAVGASGLYSQSFSNSGTAYYSENVAIGYEALYSNQPTGSTNGDQNTAVGSYSLRSNTIGQNNVAVGHNALYSGLAGTGAVAIGHNAMLYANDQATAFTNTNVAVGFQSLRGSATASANTGNHNTAVGYNTLAGNTTGSENAAFGRSALLANTTGGNNTAVGTYALTDNTTGGNNTAVGWRSQFNNSTSSQNTSVGTWSLYSITSSGDNTAIGYRSQFSNASGFGNTSIGSSSLYANTSGDGNSAFGYATLQLNTIGEYNAAFGGNALGDNTSASRNTAIGGAALGSQSYNNSGTTWNTENTALGYSALLDNDPTSNTNAYQNTAAGAFALQNNSTGSFNTALGYNTGSANTTGSSNTFIGYLANSASANLSNATSVGANASVGQSNALILGNNADVGIGTSTPTAKLDVVGDATIDTLNINSAFTFPSIDGSNGQVLKTDGAGNLSWQSTGLLNNTLTGTGTVNRMAYFFAADSIASHDDVFIDATNNRLGIGTAAPAQKLHVVGSARVSAGFLANAGTNGTPSFRFDGDANTGLYNPGADQLGVSAGGVARLLVTTTGLTINSAYTLPYTDGTNAQVLTTNGAGAVSWGTVAGDGNGIYSGSGSLSAATTVTQAANTLAFTSTATNGFSIDGTTFSVDAANNRIGVGTAAPAYPIDVNGAIRSGIAGLDGQFRMYSEQGATDYEVVFNPNAAMTQNTTYTLPADDGGASQVLTTDGSGVLSWGTVAGDGNGIYSGSGSLSAATTVTQAANTLAFTSTATNGFSVDGTTFSVDAANNRIGVGTAAPAYPIDVNGAIRSGIAGLDGQFRMYSEQGATDYEVVFNPAAAMTQNTTYTLPVDDGGASQVLSTDGSGVLSWASQSGNGIYSGSGSLSGATTVTQAANTLAFTSTATNGFSVDGNTFSVDAANNRIGVGTAAPAYPIDVNGAIRSGIAGLDGQFRMYSEQGATDYEVVFNPNAAMTQNTTYTLPVDDGGASQVLTTDGAGVLSWAAPTGDGNGIYSGSGSLSAATTVTQAANTLAFTSTATNGFSIDGTTFSVDAANNRIGVGTAAPAYPIDVNGAIRSGIAGLDGQFRMYSEQGATDYEVVFNPAAAMTQNTTYTLPIDDGAASQVLSTDGSGVLSWASQSGNGIYSGSGSLSGATTVTQAANTLAFTSTATNGFSVDGTTFSVDAANNRIGIGTSAPAINMHISATSNPELRVQATDATSANLRLLTTVREYNISSSSAGALLFTDATSSAVRFRVDPAGQFGIGTITPTYKLDVEGPIRSGMAGTDGQLRVYSEQGATDYEVVFNPAAGMTQNTTYTLPTNDGNASQVLTTDGAGALSWAAPIGDNLGNHFATQNIELDTNWLSGDGDDEGIYVNASGRVGFGTNAPAARFHILDNSGPLDILLETPDTASAKIEFRNALHEYRVGVNADSSFTINDATAGVRRLIMTATGKFGLGMGNGGIPAYTLDVKGAIRTGNNNADGQLRIYSEQGATDYEVVFNPPATMTQNTTYTLPANDGNANDMLISNGAGVLSWGSSSTIGNGIYSGSGSLSGATTVTQAANTLAFTSTVANAFSVDGTTFSVDAANDRVGIGTSAPSASTLLDVVTPAAATHRTALNINNQYNSTGITYGIQNTISNAGTGIRYGILNTVNGNAAQTNTLYGVFNDVNAGNTEQSFGTYNALGNTGTGIKYGTYNLIQNNASQTGTSYAILNNITPAADEIVYGNYTAIGSGGTGLRYGNFTQVNTNAGDSLSYGHYMSFSHVASNSAYGSFALFSGAGTGARYGYYADLGTTGTGADYGVYVTNEARNYFSGQIGIGETNPSRPVHIRTIGGNTQIFLQTTTNATVINSNLGTIAFGDNQSTSNQVSIQAERDAASSGATDLPSRIRFFTTPDGSTVLTEAMRITDDQFVGIGITAPSEMLDVNGNIEIPAANDYQYATAKTNYASVSPNAFTANTDPTSIYVSGPATGNSRYFVGGTTGTIDEMFADVQLPHGAVVTDVTANILDSDATYDVSVEFTRKTMGGSTIISTLATTAASTGSTGAQAISASSLNITINNSLYGYYLVFNTRQNTATLRIMGVVITYTVTKAD